MKKILISLFTSISCFAATPGWTDLPNTKLQSVCPAGITGTCWAVISAWSGGAADTLRNRLIIWGGGHNDYYGNEVYALNLNANPVTLTRLNSPSPPNTTGAFETTLSDGNPNSRHTYNGLTYITSADRMLAFGGVPADLAGGFSADLWTLNLATLSWQAMDPANGAAGQQPGNYYTGEPPIAVYDPNSNLTFIIDSSLGYIWSYNYATNTYTRLPNNAGLPFNSTPVLDPKIKTIFFFGNGTNNPGNATASQGSPNIYALNLSGGSYALQNITSQTTGCAGLAGAYNPGVAYDSVLDKIVGWPNFGNTVYIFDPVAMSCTSQTFPGGPPDSTDFNATSYTTGTFGRFQYFPALDAFVVVNSWTNDAYMLRLTSSTGTPSSPSLPAISSFTASPASLAVGSAATLSWTTSGATSVSISPGLGSVAVSGSGTVTPAASTTYTLTATNNSGSATATAAVAVSGTSVSPAPTITSFTASPSSITTGQSSTLSWVVTGATSVAITPGTFVSTVGSSSTSVSPSTSTLYTLTATNAAGSSSAQIAITLGATSSPPTPPAADTVIITNSGATVTNYPVQIGRPFIQGEIPNGQLPQASFGATAIPTQVDVKSRWPDNSLKHAVISFLIPTFTAGQSYTITFTPGTTVGNTPLTSAQMLAAPYNFDAQISLTNGTTKTASARTMLTNGDYTVWASGPIATTIILANHAQTTTCNGNAASIYDFGFDSYCAFRPEFEATFWPATNQVFVRYIGEIANTEQLENVTVTNLVLTLGNANPATVYTLPSSLSPLSMGALTRWTMTYWLNGTPPPAGYNHNLAYLTATQLIANYDTSKVIPGTQITSAYSAWTGAASADPYDAADFTKDQTAVGSRHYPADEIGPYTGPEVMWMYAGDYRAQQMAIRYAELSGAWPIHWREGKAGKYIDRAHTISGVGHWMSVSSRPTYCIGCGATYFNYSGIAAADKVTPVGTTSYAGWVPNVAHEPDWMPVYLLTGDYYFLEETWAWASYTTLDVDGSRHDYPGRGPTGMEGHIPGNSLYAEQVRGTAWALRNRVETEAISPDGTPEQAYYDLLIKDTLAAFEGERNITSGAYNGNTMWTWGNQFAAANYCTSNPANVGLWCANPISGVSNGVPTAIPFWVPDGGTGGTNLGGYPEQASLQPNIGSTSPWMVQYVIYALGRAKDVGYPSQALLSWIAPWIIGQVTDPTFNPYLVSMYRQPTVQANGQYFTTWGAVLSTVCTSSATGCSINANAQTASSFAAPVNEYSCALDPNGDGNCSSAFEAGIALSMVADQPNGAAAWNWINTNAMTNSALNNNPKWAIIPRSISSITGPVSSCDLNGDGVVNYTDVQLAIGQALGTALCTTADLQHTGRCDVVDVQRVVNASLGSACLLN